MAKGDLTRFVKDWPWDTFTGRGKRGGRFLRYRSTVENAAEQIMSDCQTDRSRPLHSSREQMGCPEELLTETHADFCLYGKGPCVKKGVEKALKGLLDAPEAPADQDFDADYGAFLEELDRKQKRSHKGRARRSNAA